MLQPLGELWLLTRSLKVFVADYLLLEAGSIFIIVKSHGFSSDIQYYIDQLKLQNKNKTCVGVLSSQRAKFTYTWKNLNWNQRSEQ